jgi:hypothetical protein
MDIGGRLLGCGLVSLSECERMAQRGPRPKFRAGRSSSHFADRRRWQSRAGLVSYMSQSKEEAAWRAVSARS